VLFDIDYILQWVKPAWGERYFRHWSAPATLVFHNVYRFISDVEPLVDHTFLGVEPTDEPIEHDITIGPASVKWWALKCPVGYWRVLTSGFTQYFRRAPVLTVGGRIEDRQRGGISFARCRDDEAA
jgi:hypothetical protein